MFDFPCFSGRCVNSGGENLTEFRQHWSPKMAYVAFDEKEWWYHMKNKTLAVPSLPQIVYIPSRWESHVVLKRLPESTFPPKVADRKPLWQDALAREMRQCHADLPANEHVHHTWWIKFAESLQHFAEPSTLWHKALCPPLSLDAETQVPAAAAPEDEEACAPYAPVMRSGTSMDAPTTRAAEFEGLSELAASTFALVSIDGDAEAGKRPYPLACCLVQLPSSFPEGLDTKNPRAKIPLLWWWPDDETYTGKWVPWLVGNAQSKSTEFRGTLLVVDVQVKNAVYGPRTRLRDRKAYLTAASLRIIPSAQ